MADRLEFDTPAPAGERRLEFDQPAPAADRQQELRREALKKLLAPGEPGYTARLMDASTMGLTRPLSGVMEAVGGMFDPTSTFGERYRAGVQAQGDYYDRAAKNTPGAMGVATDLVGGLATAGPVRGALQTVPQQIATAVGTGAVEGAARNADTAAGAAKGAATGGAVSGVSAGVLGALMNRLGLVQEAKRAAGEATRGPSGTELKQAGGEIYKRLDDAGIAFSSQQTPGFVTDLQSTLSKAGYDKGLHKDLKELVADLTAIGGQPKTWGELQALQSRINSAVRTPGPDAGDIRRLAGEMSGSMDRFIQGTTPAMNVAGVDLAKELPEARKLWRSGTLTDQTSWLADKGTQLAADPTLRVQRNFASLADRIDPRTGRYNPYNPEQTGLIDQIVSGSKGLSKWGDRAESVGDWVLGNRGLVGIGLLGGGAGGLGYLAGLDKSTSTGIGASLVATALGSRALGRGLHNAADARTMNAVDTLIRNISTGSSVPPRIQPIPRDAFATLLAKQQAQRVAAEYGGSFQ